MAQTKSAKILHAKQIEFADECFEQYKYFIAQEFIDKFGGSYQTADQFKDIWRKEFKYSSEAEKFLKFKSRVFIGLIPDNGGMRKNPKFLKILLRKISEYLAVFVARQYDEQGTMRNKCSAEIFDSLFVQNSHVQNMANTYKKDKAKKWVAAKRKRTKSNKNHTEQKQNNIVDKVGNIKHLRVELEVTYTAEELSAIFRMIKQKEIEEYKNRQK